MAEYFAEGHLRFVNGEWRDDNGNAIEISRVRHGRWIEEVNEYGEKVHYCSECKKYAHRHYSEYRNDVVELLFDYCHHCGAKMDGGVDDG